MKLVIVETPEKAEQLARILDRGFDVRASLGQVRRPAMKELSTALIEGFVEHYEILPEGELPLAAIRKAAHQAEAIYLATSPDPEGELLAWDILECLPVRDRRKARRILLHEITPAATEAELEGAAELSMVRVGAPRCLRRMYHLVGHEVAPILHKWKLLGRADQGPGLVDLAALGLLVELEQARREALLQPGWAIDVQLEHEGVAFWGTMADTADIASGEDAFRVIESLMQAETGWSVERVERHEETDAPPAPFTVLSLLLAAEKTLRFSTGRTRQAALKLYEAGLITYPFTESTEVSLDAQQAARDAAAKLYGEAHTASQPLMALSKTPISGAGEAIRPSHAFRLPDEVTAADAGQDGALLYGLIWRRFIASQMASARDAVTALTLRPTWTGSAEPWEETHSYPHPTLFQARLRWPLADGYRAAYPETEGEPLVSLPPIEAGDSLVFSQMRSRQKVAPSVERFTGATLARLLSELGIGSPSRRAGVAERLAALGWAKEERGELLPTPRGEDALYVCRETFPGIFDLDAIAGVEHHIDEIEARYGAGEPLDEDVITLRLPARSRKETA
jgi:DNA topoisomerase-1